MWQVLRSSHYKERSCSYANDKFAFIAEIRMAIQGQEIKTSLKKIAIVHSVYAIHRHSRSPYLSIVQLHLITGMSHVQAPLINTIHRHPEA